MSKRRDEFYGACWVMVVYVGLFDLVMAVAR
jgi:hypothetical protein